MKKQDRYYTPKIEEFHIGFEFEILDNNGWGETHLVSGRHLDEGIDLDKYDEEADTNVRVKYLDQKDIEAEGWGFYKKGFSKHLKENYLGFTSKKYNCMLSYYPKTKKVSIATLDPSKNKIMLISNYDDKKVNLIKCKNRSELKQLMKQLNIKK